MVNRFVLNETSYHGAGAIQEIATEIKGRGFAKAFVCSDPDLIKFNVTKKVTDVLDDEVAYRAMQQALQQYPEMDFVYIIAGGVNGTLRALSEQKRHIRVCTFDETPMAQKALLSGRILATICQQPYEQGYQAVKAIFDKVIGQRPFGSDFYTELSIKVDQSL